LSEPTILVDEWLQKQSSDELHARANGPDDVLGIFANRDPAVTQVSLTLGRFGTLQMASEGTSMLNFARSSHFEPLLHRLVSFLLRHRFTPPVGPTRAGKEGLDELN